MFTVANPSVDFESVQYSPDGRVLVAGSDDKTAWLIDAETGAGIARLGGHDDKVNYACFSRSGDKVATVAFDMATRIWDTTTHRLLRAVQE